AADLSAVETVFGQRIALSVNLESRTAGGSVRSEEPPTGGGEGTVKLALDSISVAKNEIGAPLGAVSGHIEEGQAGGEREIHVVALRSVHFKAQLQRGRGVEFLVHGHQQP